MVSESPVLLSALFDGTLTAAASEMQLFTVLLQAATVLIHSYLELGQGCLSRLEGSFAFLILDSKQVGIPLLTL